MLRLINWLSGINKREEKKFDKIKGALINNTPLTF